MKLLNRKSLIIVLCCFSISLSQDNEELRTRLGIFDPDISGGGEDLKNEVVQNLKRCFLEIGGYEILTESYMQESFNSIKQRFPKNCREPRCVSAVGSALQLDRMLYGSVDKGEKTYGVNFTIVDVPSRKVIEKVGIESDPGVEMADVLKVAVNKLHGLVDDNLNAKVHRYYGKQVHNEKQLYISAATCLAAGLVWALINNESVDGEKIDFNEKLSGVGTGSGLIPLMGRPAAIGNCYVAASDDAYGVFYNPAGLSWASAGEVSFGYQYRFGLNNFVASFTNKATREIGFGQGFHYSSDEDNLLSEVYFVSGISYKFNELISFLRPISLGASVKILSKNIGNGETESSQKGTGIGFAIDYGLQWELSGKIRYGLLLANAPSFFQYNNISEDYKYNENEPVELSMGGTFQANYETFLICEAHIPIYKDQVLRFAGGIERIIFRVFRVRLGAEKSEGLESPWKITTGFGLNANTGSLWGKYLILDGSYEFSTLLPFSHILNFSFRFGF